MVGSFYSNARKECVFRKKGDEEGELRIKMKSISLDYNQTDNLII